MEGRWPIVVACGSEAFGFTLQAWDQGEAAGSATGPGASWCGLNASCSSSNSGKLLTHSTLCPAKKMCHIRFK